MSAGVALPMPPSPLSLPVNRKPGLDPCQGPGLGRKLRKQYGRLSPVQKRAPEKVMGRGNKASSLQNSQEEEQPGLLALPSVGQAWP